MIPLNITVNDIRQALNEIDKSGYPETREPTEYYLKFNENRYPPKVVISIANKFANGQELDSSKFNGGEETNSFLSSRGFEIINQLDEPISIDEELEEDNKEQNDFAIRLTEYLEQKFLIKVIREKSKKPLILPSGSKLYVRGSKELEGNHGYYHLVKRNYDVIINNQSQYFVIVYRDPRITFILNSDELKEIFGKYEPTSPKTRPPRWHFDIQEREGHYYLKIHNKQAKEYLIDNNLNKWNQIEDLKGKHEQTAIRTGINYWMFVVTDCPNEHMTAQQIFLTRTADKFWGLDIITPSYRAMLHKGDKVVFSYGAKKFLGTAILDSDSFELSEEQKSSLSHGQDFFRADFGVTLKDIDIWEEQKAVEKCIDSLTFVMSKGADEYAAYFVFRIQKISEEDYNIITNISKSNIMSFTDLQKFLLKEMQMQANYQPIMIRTLLQSRGKATKDDIAAKIKELNSEKADQDFKNVPVYDVLEKHEIVRKHDNEFVLNNEELTVEQSNQLIALCNWKILTQPLQLEELIEAFDKNKSLFDPDRITLEESERLRSSFVSDFAIDKIQAMKLDEYVTGKPNSRSAQVDKTTFCYRLERGLPGQGGIQGVVAQKFGIFFNREEQVYKYNKEKYDSPEKAFDAIKSQIYSILQAGKQFKEDKNWEILSKVVEYNDYDIYRLVRSKILSVYYPEHFIRIHSLNHLQHILEAFGKSTIDIKDKFFLTQARLLEVKNEHPIMKQWHNNDFSHFAWHAIVERNSASTKQSDKQLDAVTDNKLSIWVVRAGSKGEQENAALEKNIVTIGWNGLPDLSQVQDKESLKQLYFKTDPNAKEMAVSNMVGSIWRFVNEIKKGDLVVLPLLSQDSKTVAVGRVEGDYEYKELTPDIKHIRPVKWLEKSILKSEFDEDTIKHLQMHMTVFQIKNDNAIKGIVKVLQKYGVSDIDIHTDRFDVIDSELTRKGENTTVNKLELRGWQSLTAEDIDEIVSLVLHSNKEKERRRLAIAPETVKRIVIHLISSKHVILVSPPGTGKTDLSRRLLQELSKRIVRKSDPIEAVASYEWGRYEVIGGNSLKTDSEGNNHAFHLGCVTKAIKEGKLLLIDEFNRADMNKAFGEMFLAIDHGTIQLSEDENPDFDLSLYDNLKNRIRIPEEFRMICTMNDYDKSLLNELSYGLLRRFAFVEIDTPTNKDEEMNVVIERLKISNNNASFNESVTDEVIKIISPQVDKFLDFMLEIRKKRKLGVSTSIDVAKYIAVGYALTNKADRSEDDDNNILQWKLLNEALVDYVLPQLDRLDLGTLMYVKEVAYKTLLDDQAEVPDIIRTGFISKLENVISGLDYINRLFATPKNSEEV